MAVWKVPRKKPILNFRPNSIGGFAVSETKKTTEPKYATKSIGGFAVSDTEKTPQRKKSICGFTVNKTDERPEKFYRWFFGDFD